MSLARKVEAHTDHSNLLRTYRTTTDCGYETPQQAADAKRQRAAAVQGLDARTVAGLQSQNPQLQLQLSVLTAASVDFAWITSTVDKSLGVVGEYTSLAFGPDGPPAIAYFDTTNGNLKFARKAVFQLTP